MYATCNRQQPYTLTLIILSYLIDRVKINIKVNITQNMSFWRRSSKPTFWIGTEKLNLTQKANKHT